MKAREKKFKDLLGYERKLRRRGCDLIIGVDEAGRGPLAGPVVAAAVALKTTIFKNRIDDSKKLSLHRRQKAFEEITRKSIFGISVVSEKMIDRINILQATRLAMRQAVISLTKKIAGLNYLNIHVIVDGKMSLELNWPCTDIVKGDGKSKSIAAASILAKVTRDRIMREYDVIYPEYGFSRHKGYPTESHREILNRIGPSQIHRKSFHCA
ncbi:MAG: ribonuclease HII [Candidatus Omnitrophica bacterium]|nr:ribonuclease HII [Candidatus Omnitrophota bacterium]